jgi:hypothetical protein
MLRKACKIGYYVILYIIKNDPSKDILIDNLKNILSLQKIFVDNN